MDPNLKKERDKRERECELRQQRRKQGKGVKRSPPRGSEAEKREQTQDTLQGFSLCAGPAPSCPHTLSTPRAPGQSPRADVLADDARTLERKAYK
ncbi:hypothetical protein AAFF_G00204630 [Aldrovandia affinis]|uniref:Uncharacterized protein n=1 Tax=Aldrovandia affinis TaxID=143900 RepID=A0AAD7RIB3_9TELE|nr:hypothetical protein AAFF_G00204630 [Aldrovandia affinis]